MDTNNPSSPLKKRRVYGPDVRIVVRGGATLVEKTYRDRPFPVRILGRLLVMWEGYIYSRLTGIPGIPQTAPSPDAYTLTTTYMGGCDLRRKDRTPDKRYFDELERLLDAVHQRGVIHLDLRNRRNYGMDEEGRPYLVDFASSIYLPGKGIVWRMLRRIDRLGVTKLKAKLNPALLSEKERMEYIRGANLSRLWLPRRLLSLIKHAFGRSPRRGRDSG